MNTIKQNKRESIDAYASRIAKICEQLGLAKSPVDVTRRMKALVQGLCSKFGTWKALLQHQNDTLLRLAESELVYKDDQGNKYPIRPNLKEENLMDRYDAALQSLRAQEEEIRYSASSRNHNRMEMAMSVRPQQGGFRQQFNRPPPNNNNLRPVNNNNNTIQKVCFKCG